MLPSRAVNIYYIPYIYTSFEMLDQKALELSFLVIFAYYCKT